MSFHRLPEGLTLTTLQPKDAPALCERWRHYRPDPALDLYMQEVTRRFDSSAIVNAKGELMAYVGMQFNGAMAMLHVEPQHRGQGLGQIVLRDLTRKLLAKKKTAYGLIPTKDTSFLATSSQKLGFTWVPLGSMAWVRYEPKASPVPQPRGATSLVSKPLGAATTAACPGTSAENGECCDEEDGRLLFLTALPLSCNECADISSDVSNVCSHVRIGIS